MVFYFRCFSFDKSLSSAGSPATEANLPVNVGGTQANGSESSEAGIELLIHPYERLKVVSNDPVAGIDITKREVPLLHSSRANLIYSYVLDKLPLRFGISVHCIPSTPSFQVQVTSQLQQNFYFHPPARLPFPLSLNNAMTITFISRTAFTSTFCTVCIIIRWHGVLLNVSNH